MDVSDAQTTRDAVRTITDALPHLAWTFDAALHLEYANEAYRAYTGLSLDEARTAADRAALVHPDDLPAMQQRWNACVVAAQSFEMELRVRRADGEYRRMDVRAVPIALGAADGPRWIGTAVDVDDVRRTDMLLRGIIDTAPQLIWASRPDGVIEYWNPRLREYTGQLAEPELGIAWQSVMHPDDVARASDAYAQALRDETPYEVQYRLRRHDGVYRWFLARAEPARDADGRVVRWIGTATDIDDRKRAEDAMQFLLDATGVVAGRREIEAVLHELTDLAVREFAGTCALFRPTRNGAIALSALSSREPAQGALLGDIVRMYPPRAQDPVGAVLAKNTAALYAAVGEPALAATAYDARHLALLRRLDPRSLIDVPLSARGEALGALQFARYAGDPPFDERDVATAQILANRVAGAMDEALTRESERRLAETFQASALPRRLPTLPGIEVKAIYSAAEVGINVGGDWYDSFELSPWRLVVSIGDVAGKGVEAAATMSLIRHGIRFAAHRGQDPADILAVVDAALRDESPDLTATAFVAIVDIRESRVRYASAGHPPAALRQPDGRVRMLAVEPAPPLGTWPEGLRPRVDTAPLVYGALLVLYTDGLTEIGRDAIDGERRLIAALRDEAAYASTNPARFVRDAVVDGRPVRDDVAVIALAYGRRAGWEFESLDALRAQPARTSFEAWLKREAEGDTDAAALIFGELVGNVVRHAPGPIELRAEWRDDGLVLHAFDSGPGFEPARALPDDSNEGGRGLYIIRTLAKAVAVAPNARGTRVSVTLPVTRKRPS